MPKGELEKGTSALDTAPDFTWDKCVAQATMLPAGVMEDALHSPLLGSCAETSITVPDVDATPVKGFFRRSFCRESVSKPSWEIRHPQHSLIC